MKKILLFLLFAIAIITSSCDDVVNMGRRASIISEDFVKDKVKYPATIDFDRLDYRWEPINYDETSGIVYKKFTTKNVFGVPVQFVYKIEMSFLGGEWEDTNNWTYKYIVVEEIPSGKKYYYTPYN